MGTPLLVDRNDTHLHIHRNLPPPEAVAEVEEKEAGGCGKGSAVRVQLRAADKSGNVGRIRY
jgi:hypothetical protein